MPFGRFLARPGFFDPETAARASEAAGNDPAFGEKLKGFAAAALAEQPQPAGLVQGGDTSNLPVTTRPEAPANTGTSEATTTGGLGEVALDAYLLNRPVVGPVKPEILSGENPAAVGGYRGAERFGKAFDVAPRLAQESVLEAADIQKAEGGDLEQHYANLTGQARDLAAQRIQHQRDNIAQLQQKQAELEKQTQVYSQNLSDRKAFWKNPQNVVSAIGFALLPMAGVTGGVGVKLIHNAIQQDLENRKQLADSHLGALKSNLTGYRQLAGDIEAGDALAEAESYRVAALEVQRIAAHYQGPKAQAQSKAIIADLMNKSNLSAMDAYNRMMYKAPTPMTSQMAREYQGQPDFQRFGPKGGGNTRSRFVYDELGNPVAETFPQALGQAPPSREEAAVRALGGTPSASTGPSYAPNSALLEAKRGPPQPSDEAKLLSELDKQSPGLSKLAKPFYDNLTVWARGLVQNPDLHPEQVRTKRAELLQDIKKQTAEIEKANRGTVGAMAGTAQFQKDIRDLEAAFGGDPRRINDFLGTIKKYPGSVTLDDLMASSGLKGEDAQRKLVAIRRIQQALMGQMNQYYKETSGTAINTSEAERLHAVVNSNSPYELIKSFSNMLSTRHSGDLRGALAGQNSLAAQYYRIRLGQQFPELDNPGK